MRASLGPSCLVGLVCESRVLARRIAILDGIVFRLRLLYSKKLSISDYKEGHIMDVTRTNIPGVLLFEPKVFGDHRGYFCETYSRRELAALGLDVDFVQANEAFSAQAGVLRGLHFQAPPMAQAKLVRVGRGAVYDVVVDMRKGSPTFGRWQGFTLSAVNFLQLFIPAGFAHGYMTLEADTQFLYKVDQFYSPEHDGGISCLDPDLGIDWPGLAPIMSDKDLRLPCFADFDSPFSM
ncbi:dTDP-4-dehydrorhamnose 3,5-epimerase [Desulfomicrobium apsheronum]|uniref:dTDP-4-dehydrorhamnose 3,5-epimerase n=2 Tax=Desulfomicrobium apsheronum TaxID=52560 RepID=A0A1I3NQH0_9BACT|nr:dTDP-4-dehydrorhamnose 3,5-epimerase [Desulfomicrobium apsheronum]